MLEHCVQRKAIIESPSLHHRVDGADIADVGERVAVEEKKIGIHFLLGMAGFIVMADNWVVSPILPSISQNINVDIARAGLLITAYMIPFGIFQILFGPLADRYGKKQVITFSMILFTVSAALCAFGSNLTNLSPTYRSSARSPASLPRR